MNISHTIKGTEKLFAKIETLVREGDRASAIAVANATLAIHAAAVRSIQDNDNGTPAIRYDPKRHVKVSLPGSPPNTDTGRLVQSIKFETSDKGLVGRVGTNLKYGVALEFGTKKMEPRPWLAPAVMSTEKEIGQIFAAEISAVVKGVTK